MNGTVIVRRETWSMPPQIAIGRGIVLRGSGDGPNLVVARRNGFAQMDVMKISRRQAIQISSFAVASVMSGAAWSRGAEGKSAGAEGKKVFPIREIYCPAHFGNSYEAMWSGEMKEYLAELKWWGFNRYGDWPTTTDIRSPFRTDKEWDLSREQLDRKTKAFRVAQDLGLALNLIITPNHVYLDQLRPEIAAVKKPKIAGQLVCPSQAGGRKAILDNAENWFRHFAENGVRLSAFTAFAYDYGGCACKLCNPWILTFARLAKEIHGIALKWHANIEPWFCSWWWRPEEHAVVNAWARENAPGWLKGMTLHLEYNQTRFKDVPLPEGCRKIAFVHDGYADQSKDSDLYAKWGPVVAPARLPETLKNIASDGADGFQVYSEGVFDDVNKAILGGVGSGRFVDVTAVLKQYAERYFGCGSIEAASWAQWLAAWGSRKTVKFPEAKQRFEELARSAKPSWRLEQWRCKVVLEKLDRAIGSPKQDEWTLEKLKLADAFWTEQERLHRDVYKLGPTRHIFAPQFNPPTWYQSWQKATKAAPAQLKMRPEA
jgi:hypothetical protein